MVRPGSRGSVSRALSRPAPAQVFAEREARLLLPAPVPYDIPVFATGKVHRDFHLEVGTAAAPVPSRTG